jgi:hypothetical protein
MGESTIFGNPQVVDIGGIEFEAPAVHVVGGYFLAMVVNATPERLGEAIRPLGASTEITLAEDEVYRFETLGPVLQDPDDDWGDGQVRCLVTGLRTTPSKVLT